MPRTTTTAILLLVGCSAREPREELPAAAMTACKSREVGCPRPILPVSSLEGGLAYYRDRLGFKVDWQYGEPPDFASVTRDDATLFVAATNATDDVHVWMGVRDVDKLHRELVKRGAIIKQPPTNMPWGARELHVADRDGNLLRFGGPTR
jgi:catechol 2,3-dioxygenase-like lactoylglutathione lyase family enzyme